MKITEKRIRQLIRESLQRKILKESDGLPTGSDLKLLNDLATGSNASGSRNSQLDKVLSAIKKGKPGDLKKLLDQNPKIKTYSEKFPVKGVKEKETPNTTSEKGNPTSPERINKFADSLNKKMKNLKQLKASDEDKKNFQEFVDAVKKKDLKKAGEILSNHRDDFESAFDNESEASSDFKRLRQGIRSSLGAGKKGGGSGARKRKKKSDPKIKIVQGLINSIIDKNKIDGDYSGKKLSTDGFWGSRTRSAVSKALSLFTQSALRNKYGFKGISEEGLNKEKSGGAGSWKNTLAKLVKGVSPEGNGSDNFGKGKYGNLIYVLTKLNEDSTGGSGDETIPDQADGSYFYHAPRIEFPIKGGIGFKITFKDGKVTKMEANDNVPLSKKGFNVKDPKEYNTKLFKKSIKDGGLVPGKLDGDKIIPADEPQKAAGPKKPFTKYGDELKKNAPKKMVNLLKIGEGTYKVATDSRAGTTTYESQRHKITDAKFKDVELSSPDWAGKSKGSYMLATTWRRRDATAVDLYFYEPKGQLTIDGPQFWNYRIDGYAKLNDGTLVPEDYAKHLNKSNK